jgi:hypothetical protein
MGSLFLTTNGPIFIILLLSNPASAYAQGHIIAKFSDPYSINVAGHSNLLDNQNLDWSVGEASLIRTFNKHPIYLLSSGFLQSHTDPLLQYNNLDSFDVQIKAGPNPFNSCIYIQCKQDGMIISSVELFNFRGDRIYHLPGYYSGLNFYKEVPIQKLSNPICYLYISYSIAEKMYRTKIIKLIQN